MMNPNGTLVITYEALYFAIAYASFCLYTLYLFLRGY